MIQKEKDCGSSPKRVNPATLKNQTQGRPVPNIRRKSYTPQSRKPIEFGLFLDRGDLHLHQSNISFINVPLNHRNVRLNVLLEHRFLKLGMLLAPPPSHATPQHNQGEQTDAAADCSGDDCGPFPG